MDFNHLLPQWLSLPPAEVQGICFNGNTRELKKFVVSGNEREEFLPLKLLYIKKRWCNQVCRKTRILQQDEMNFQWILESSSPVLNDHFLCVSLISPWDFNFSFWWCLPAINLSPCFSHSFSPFYLGNRISTILLFQCHNLAFFLHASFIWKLEKYDLI